MHGRGGWHVFDAKLCRTESLRDGMAEGVCLHWEIGVERKMGMGMWLSTCRSYSVHGLKCAHVG